MPNGQSTYALAVPPRGLEVGKLVRVSGWVDRLMLPSPFLGCVGKKIESSVAIHRARV